MKFCSKECRNNFNKTSENPSKNKSVRKLLSSQKMGSKNPKWAGGKKKTYSHIGSDRTNPYIKIKLRTHPLADSEGYVMEHRLVVEKYIGRYLTIDEVIHHINGSKSDNRIENLKLLTASEHNSFHAIEKGFGTLIRAI